MTARETPVVFDCEGESLVGIVHLPAAPRRRGVLAVVAGGPQYRAGCCRQLVLMGRALAARGIPVMRFDYRGLGDGAGVYRGFEHVGPDLDAAIGAFRREVPGLDEVVLWGGCDAASAVLIHGPHNPYVKGMVLGNPWVHTEATHAKVVVRHYYLRRLRERSFWLKLLRFRMNPFEKLMSLLGMVRLARSASSQAEGGDARPFPQRMLAGLSRFEGRILMMMSGLSLVSKEFDELVASSPAWSAAMAKVDVTRAEFPDADQAFSTIAARDRMIEVAGDWLERWPDDPSALDSKGIR